MHWAKMINQLLELGTSADAANNRFAASSDSLYHFGAAPLYKANTTPTARLSGQLVLNRATEYTSFLGERRSVEAS